MIGLSERLRYARQEAGYDTATSAAERFGWKVSTYAGHENGARSPRDAALRIYAKAFGVTKEWLRYGSGTYGAPAPATPATTGFSEGMVADFAPAQDRTRTSTEAVARSLTPNIGRMMLHVAAADFLDLALRRGDILICDLEATPQPGETVIINIPDLETGSAETMIGRILPPYFDPAGGIGPIDLTTTPATIYAVVATVIRPPQQ